MVVGTQRKAVRQAGPPASAPGMWVMDVAPRERPLAPLHRTGVVLAREPSAHREFVHPLLDPDVGRLRSPPKSCRAHPRLAGQATSLPRRDAGAGVEPCRRQPV